MNTISLLTDFGLVDHFVGVMKGVILKINPAASVVDICNEVKPQGIFDAAFLLRNSYAYFPNGTVHLVVVDPGVGTERKAVIVKTKNYFFVGPDNGVLDLALKEEKPTKIIHITNDKYFLKPVSDTFHGRDIFAPVAAYLSKGKSLSNFGKKIGFLKNLEFPDLCYDEKKLKGEVVYIDRFGNLITNIDSRALEKFIKGNKFIIKISGCTLDKLSRGYSEAGTDAPLALIGSFGFLEVSVNIGSASAYFSARKGTAVEVEIL